MAKFKLHEYLSCSVLLLKDLEMLPVISLEAKAIGLSQDHLSFLEYFRAKMKLALCGFYKFHHYTKHKPTEKHFSTRNV